MPLIRMCAVAVALTTFASFTPTQAMIPVQPTGGSQNIAKLSGTIQGSGSSFADRYYKTVTAALGD